MVERWEWLPPFDSFDSIDCSKSAPFVWKMAPTGVTTVYPQRKQQTHRLYSIACLPVDSCSRKYTYTWDCRFCLIRTFYSMTFVLFVHQARDHIILYTHNVSIITAGQHIEVRVDLLSRYVGLWVIGRAATAAAVVVVVVVVETITKFSGNNKTFV